MIDYSLPATDEAEISIFGPGVGESLVVHLGNQRWFIVDSCLSPTTKRPISLDYLSAMGVDLQSQVIGLLVTHWHADHILGASEILETCTAARFFCPSALLSNEARQLAKLYQVDRFSSTDKEVREFSQIIASLKAGNDRSRFQRIGARHVLLNSSSPTRISLTALSPSNAAIDQSVANLVRLTPVEGEPRYRQIVPQTENHNAVALHFRFGETSALLGSDLEESGNLDTGWSAILDSGIYDDLELSPSKIFKVPHHGSATGHHDNVWSNILSESPLSITSTYSPSSLPRQSDIERVSSQSSEFWVTKPSGDSKPKRRDPMVERELRGILRARSVINNNVGHVRIRFDSHGRTTLENNDLPVRHVA